MAFPAYLRTSVSGGNGSFSYGDTSVYGPKGLYSTFPPSGQLIIPGSGGGAKQSPVMIFGGRVQGSNPNGVVLIRLLKIE